MNTNQDYFEYIGTFKSKTQIYIPPPITSKYMCAICKTVEAVPVAGFKEIKGIGHDCCICMDKQASILCATCSAIHSCVDCVTKMIITSQPFFPYRYIGAHVCTPPVATIRKPRKPREIATLNNETTLP